MLITLGYLIVVGSVFGGYWMIGGYLGALYQPPEILMIVGAAMGAFVASNNGKAIKATLRSFSKLKRTNKYNKAMYMELLALQYKLLSKARRDGMLAIERDIDDPQVLRGKQVFHDSGCASCHRPKFVTARLEDRPEHSFQLIWPHTDLLLHDMGEGLADHRPEGRATGREWKTPPLWGIGLTERISGHTTFLHDGRARSLLEAILWHGGEAQAARDAVVSLAPAARADLIRYLESL